MQVSYPRASFCTRTNATFAMTTDITDKSIFSKIPLDFYCRCSKSNFLTHLASFGQQELENMQVRKVRKVPNENVGDMELLCSFIFRLNFLKLVSHANFAMKRTRLLLRNINSRRMLLWAKLLLRNYNKLKLRPVYEH